MAKQRYVKIKPSNHEEWLSLRDFGIGASEAGAILGASSYSSPYRVWRRKVGIDEPVKENWAMKQGHIFEQHVAELFAEEYGADIIGLHSVENRKGKIDWLAVDAEKPHLRVSPDWMYYPHGAKHNEANKMILECKTSRVNYTPDCLSGDCLSWFIQVQYQMYVLGKQSAYLGFLNVETGDHWFEEIPYSNPFTVGTLIPQLEEFWFKHVLPARQHLRSDPTCSKEELEQFAPAIIDSDDTLCKFPKELAGKYIELDGDTQPLIDQYSNLRLQSKDIEKQIDEVTDKLKIAMGDAEAIIGSNGKPIVTWRAIKDSIKFDDKTFAKEHKDLYEQYLVTKPGARVFRVK